MNGTFDLERPVEMLLGKYLIEMTARITLFKSHLYFAFSTCSFLDALPTSTKKAQYCMILYVDVR
jgi:hypothetical protein